MTQEQLYGELEGLLARLGIEIRVDSMDEELNSNGGLCKVQGKPTFIINRILTYDAKISLLLRSLRSFDLGGIYIKPYIREMIEGEY